MLEVKVSSLEEMLNYFEELRDKLIKFLQDKFFSTNKYDDIIDELYEEEILDNDDIDTIKNEYSKDDELER
jgi:SOS response regulatory protein OraA/RecX